MEGTAATSTSVPQAPQPKRRKSSNPRNEPDAVDVGVELEGHQLKIYRAIVKGNGVNARTFAKALLMSLGEDGLQYIPTVLEVTEGTEMIPFPAIRSTSQSQRACVKFLNDFLRQVRDQPVVRNDPCANLTGPLAMQLRAAISYLPDRMFWTDAQNCARHFLFFSEFYEYYINYNASPNRRVKKAYHVGPYGKKDSNKYDRGRKIGLLVEVFGLGILFTFGGWMFVSNFLPMTLLHWQTASRTIKRTCKDLISAFKDLELQIIHHLRNGRSLLALPVMENARAHKQGSAFSWSQMLEGGATSESNPDAF